MLDYWVTTMVEITISTSFIIVLLLLLRPFTGKKYAVKWRYWLWLAVALRLLIPINITLPQAPIQIDSPNTNSPLVISEGVLPSPHGTAALDRIGATEAEQSMSVQHIAAFVWLTGVALVLTYHSIGHFLFLRRTKRWGTPITEPKVLEQYKQMMEHLRVKRNVALKTSKSISSPMLTGLAKPTVWLPANSYSQEELQVIFKHELIHYKQHHLWYKLIMLCT